MLFPILSFFRSHFMIAVIISILKSNRVNREYIRIANHKTKEMLLDVISSKYVPVNYKIAMVFYLINPTLLKLILSLRR